MNRTSERHSVGALKRNVPTGSALIRTDFNITPHPRSRRSHAPRFPEL
jgi:hypothetical protein